MNTKQFSFHKTSECAVEENSNHRIYLTFDIDWACDEVLADTIDLVEKADVSATWFVTHETPLLERLRRNAKFELGIHPNFNFLLAKNPVNNSSPEEIIDNLLNIVPEARSIRSHSLTQNSMLQELFKSKGITHECNHLIPEQSGMELKPWVLWNGLIKVPHYWEDDAVCLYKDNTPIEEVLVRKGLKVFDFHPIHVFLNTEALDRYERTRKLHRDASQLIEHRYEGNGTRSKLLQIVTAHK